MGSCHVCPILLRKIESLSAAENRAMPSAVCHEIATLLCNLAQILDVVKVEWAESWSEWDQQQRDGITAFLTSYYVSRAEADGQTKL